MFFLYCAVHQCGNGRILVQVEFRSDAAPVHDFDYRNLFFRENLPDVLRLTLLTIEQKYCCINRKRLNNNNKTTAYFEPDFYRMGEKFLRILCIIPRTLNICIFKYKKDHKLG